MFLQEPSHRYYAVEFQYPGKKKALLLSGDMILEKGATEAQVHERGVQVLLKAFSEIFPDEALPFLNVPDHIKIIPGPTIFYDPNDHKE